jgi:hypothetical protein
MQITFLFDSLYYSLSVTMILVLIVATILGLKIRSGITDANNRRIALGTSLAALGALIIIAETVPLLAMYRDSLLGGFLYQQLQFSIAYIGLGIVLYGIDITLLSKMQIGVKHSWLRIFVLSIFFLALAFSSSHLFNPSTYAVTYSGSVEHAAQQLVFWLPMFLTLIVGATAASVVFIRTSGTPLRPYAIWFALFFALILVGALRESTIIPSFGDPFTDLLVAFTPFVAGSFCILMSARSLSFVLKDISGLITTHLE